MEEIQQKLAGAIKEVFEVEMTPELVEAPEEIGADYASNVAMRLAKVAHKSPMLIAEDLKKQLEGDELKVEIAVPGFLNFISPDEYFIEKVQDFAENGLDFREIILSDEYVGKTVVTEFSDPNPFKVLHVGHLYTSIVGDSISRLLELAGAKVVRANFGGDVGLHVAKTLYILLGDSSLSGSVGLSESSPADRDSDPAQPDNQNFQTTNLQATSIKGLGANAVRLCDLTIEDIAKAYVEGTRAYDEDPEAKAEITRLNKMIYRIAALGEEESIALGGEEGELAKWYWRGRTLSYEYFKAFYAEIGVKFDKFYPESTVADKGVEEVKAHIGTTYEESDGAIVYRGEKVGLHTRVFINREGVPTYETKDVGLIFTKWADWKFDESVVITGNEQTDYMKVVLASVKEYAPELVERTRHLTHGLVKLPGNVKMSSRKGNFLKAVDVLRLVEATLSETSVSADARLAHRTLSTARSDAPASLNSLDTEASSNSRKIVLAAVKYAFLKYKMGGDIVFDPKESVAMNGNSGVYLLYSMVRAKKVLEKLDVGRTSDEGELSEEERKFERSLSKKIVQYGEVLNTAILEKAPYKICTYLYELAQEFSRFYEHVKVAGSVRELELGMVVKAYLKVMEGGMGALGITEIPDAM